MNQFEKASWKKQAARPSQKSFKYIRKIQKHSLLRKMHGKCQNFNLVRQKFSIFPFAIVQPTNCQVNYVTSRGNMREDLSKNIEQNFGLQDTYTSGPETTIPTFCSKRKFWREKYLFCRCVFQKVMKKICKLEKTRMSFDYNPVFSEENFGFITQKFRETALETVLSLSCSRFVFARSIASLSSEHWHFILSFPIHVFSDTVLF